MDSVECPETDQMLETPESPKAYNEVLKEAMEQAVAEEQADYPERRSSVLSENRVVLSVGSPSVERVDSPVNRLEKLNVEPQNGALEAPLSPQFSAISP